MKTIIQNGMETIVPDDTPCKSVNGVLYALSEEDLAQIERDKAEWEASAEDRAAKAIYKIRERAYGTIGDQLDMQYWDKINGTTNWERHIMKVKKDHPKPIIEE